MTTPFRLLAVLTLALGALLTGCKTIKYDATGETRAVYVMGEFKMILNASSPQAVTAIQTAFGQLNITTKSVTTKNFSAVVEGTTLAKQTVVIKLEEMNRNQTSINIVWGKNGDLNNSKVLYEAIDAQLQ